MVLGRVSRRKEACRYKWGRRRGRKALPSTVSHKRQWGIKHAPPPPAFSPSFLGSLNSYAGTYKLGRVQALLAQQDMVLDPLDAFANDRVIVFRLRLLRVLYAELPLSPAI